MTSGFWSTLKRPILALAPMADVTDPAFRRIISARSPGFGHVTWTEFVSADGLAKAPEEGRKKLLADLQYSPIERPIVAQFFTSNPRHMEMAAALARELGFDGVDINMGCPDKSIEKQGAGSAHIKNPELAQEVIRAAQQGAQHLPVSVKTRLGYNQDQLETWLPKILETNPAVVTVHARTRKEMSLVPARWERVQRAVEIRNERGSSSLILGNGDLKNVEDAYEKCAQTGADGAMLGRAIFGNPWLFANSQEIAQEERLRTLLEHCRLYEELLPHKSFSIMKKHFKAYVKDFSGAAELRGELMNTSNSEEVAGILERYVGSSAV